MTSRGGHAACWRSAWVAPLRRQASRLQQLAQCSFLQLPGLALVWLVAAPAAASTKPTVPQPWAAIFSACTRVQEEVCVFGGSVGAHDEGLFTGAVSCYDRAARTWHRPLPQLPVPADHLSVVRVPAGVNCGGVDGEEPERLLVLNFRKEPYGLASTEVRRAAARRGHARWGCR